MKFEAVSKFFLSVAFLAAFCSGYEWSFMGLSINPERIMVFPSLLLLAFLGFARKRKLTVSLPGALLFLWCVCAFFSSALSPVFAWSLKMYVLQIVAVSYYILISCVKHDLPELVSSKRFLAFCFLLGPVASVSFLAYEYGYLLPVIGEDWLQLDFTGLRLKGSLIEANIFGAFLILVILLFLSFKRSNGCFWWVVFVGLNLSMYLCLSRAPWIAYILSLFVYFCLVRRRPYRMRDLGGAWFFTIVSLGFGLGVFFIFKESFFESEVYNRVGSISTRFIMWDFALSSFYEAPLIGNGIYSFSEINPQAPFLVGSDTHRSAWISNLPLAILHDTGVLGFSIFFFFLLWSVFMGFKYVRCTALDFRVSTVDVKIFAAFSAFCMSLLITGLSIPAHSMALFWLSFSILVSLVLKYRRVYKVWI